MRPSDAQERLSDVFEGRAPSGVYGVCSVKTKITRKPVVTDKNTTGTIDS